MADAMQLGYLHSGDAATPRARTPIRTFAIELNTITDAPARADAVRTLICRIAKKT